VKLPQLSIPEIFRSLQPQPAFAFGGDHATNGAPRERSRGGTMLFASGGSDGGDYDDYDDEVYDEPAQDTRRTPGAQRGSGGGSGSGGSGGGRQRSVQFQPEERYWTEYLRIALPIIGLLLMIGLFWYWASQLADDGNGGDEPESTIALGTTEIMTPESTPEPTQETIVQSTPPPVEETPTSEPQETESTPAEEPAEETPETEGGDFAVGDFVMVVEGGVNMRAEATTGSDILVELEGGDVLEITGGPEEADGYVWYEVIVSDTGEVGWVASDFLEPAE